jgi:hypothetical protein
MDFDLQDGRLKISMISDLQKMIDDLPKELEPLVALPAVVHLFEESNQRTLG